MPTGGVDLGIGALLTDTVGATAGGLIADAGVGALGGAALGGLESGVSGGNIGKGILHGAEGGALTGGGIGLGGDLLGGTIGTTAADALGGAAGGALGSEITGGKPLTGAVEGGASGALAGLTSGTPSTTSATGGPGTSAGGSAAPAGTPDTGGDVTQQFAQAAGAPPTLDTSGLTSLAQGGVNNTGDLQSIGTPNTASLSPGTPSLPTGLGGGNLSQQFTQAAGAPPTLDTSGLTSLAQGGVNGVGAGETAAPTSVDKFLSNPGAGTAFDVVKANPGAAISAAGVGLDALKQNQSLEGERQLQQEASNLAGQGSQLEGYLQSGTLPPGLQAGVNQASDAAIATIKSQYAARGMSGSSAEQQDIAAVQSRAEAQGAQMAMQLLQTGISETGMASGLYEQLLNQATQSDAQLGSAISNFASAAAGGGNIGKGGVTINYPQA